MVFRHYIHLTPSSCTSERLRSSTGLSPGFNQHRYSSLSFGSHNYCHPPSTHAAVVVSLVRDSRRVEHQFPSNSPTVSFCILLFSHFNRSTSPLSVIHRYLALDHHHHPIQTALPNSHTPNTSNTQRNTSSLQEIFQGDQPDTAASVRVYHPLCNAFKALSEARRTHNSQHQHQHINRHTGRHSAISRRALPLSLADTHGILVSFFSFP